LGHLGILEGVEGEPKMERKRLRCEDDDPYQKWCTRKIWRTNDKEQTRAR